VTVLHIPVQGYLVPCCKVSEEWSAVLIDDLEDYARYSCDIIVFTTFLGSGLGLSESGLYLIHHHLVKYHLPYLLTQYTLHVFQFHPPNVARGVRGHIEAH
jgi:hypothetical protein